MVVVYIFVPSWCILGIDCQASKFWQIVVLGSPFGTVVVILYSNGDKIGHL